MLDKEFKYYLDHQGDDAYTVRYYNRVSPVIAPAI